MPANRIRCVFCGDVAFVTKKNDLEIVACSLCNREIKLDAYQDIFDKWLDDIKSEQK